MNLLTTGQEERAARLHKESLVFITHDHCILEEEVRRMVDGGVTAKQLNLAVDVRLWGTPDRYRASRTGPELDAANSQDAAASSGFLKSALIAYELVLEMVERSDGRVSLALEADDIVDAKARGAVALLLGSEGARLTEYRVEILRVLARLGFRHLQLSWAVDHPLGATQHDMSGRGLTNLGREFVEELNRLGMIVDVSHLSYASIADAIDASSTPVLNGHSGTSALNETQPQLMPDDLIRHMAAKGGVVAIHFMSQMVKPGRDKASLDHLLDQFEHIAREVGPAHVACGPDYATHGDILAANQGIPTAFSYADGVEDISLMPNLTRGFVARGFSDVEIAGFLGGNLLRLFHDVRAARSSAPVAPLEVQALGSLTGGLTPL